jgi:ectoine hydroxylase-related dioxygenase (phytanoyl-CoA dioxygenase family)
MVLEDRHSVCAAIAEDGFALIKKPFPASWIDDLVRRADIVNDSPAIGGAVGYQVVDFPRKVLNPCTVLGGPVLDLMLHHSLLDVVEELMGSECILAQAGMRYDKGVGYNYFPLHSDFAAGWTHGEQFVLQQTHMERVLSVGCLLYLTPSREGAFCYLRGTHRLHAPKGSEWSNYSSDEQASMIANRVRVDGELGDLVMFDPRGFHGPDLPSSKPRLALIFHFYNTEVFGRRQLAPFPVYAADLGRLSPRQLRVLGVGAETFYDPLRFMGNRIRRTNAYRISRILVANAFLSEHLRRKLRATWLTLRKTF